MSFLGHFQVLVFLYVLLLFSAESRKTQLFDTESSSDDGAEHKKTTGIRSIDFSCIRSSNHKKERKWS